jgi:putative addiction module component (TIGR02574 family)
MEIETILKEALAKPQADRALIAHRLLVSLDPPGEDDVDVEAGWQEECARRLREIHDGTVQTVPWEVVHERMKKATRDPG